MSQLWIWFNPLAAGGKGEEAALVLKARLSGKQLTFMDVTKIEDKQAALAPLTADDAVLLCGGDGTLNHFANEVDVASLPCDVLYYPTGTGNDFLKDIAPDGIEEPVSVKKYLVNLPRVTVNGKSMVFLNNVGFGIDGYCCEVGDAMHAAGKEKVDYTGIAIKGLLFHFRPVNATVTVDGATKTYARCWLAPTMNGRYYGGGMMPAPAQDRLNAEHSVSVMTFFGKGKIPTLIAFPGIFKGEHVKHTDMVEIRTGHKIKVVFDTPCACQIDGETILGVTEYEVEA